MSFVTHVPLEGVVYRVNVGLQFLADTYQPGVKVYITSWDAVNTNANDVIFAWKKQTSSTFYKETISSYIGPPRGNQW